MKKLSIIIPFGTSKERPFIEERVRAKAIELKNIDDIEVIFVEGFSSQPVPSLQNIIESNGHLYYKDNSQLHFSQGMCRNLGVVYAHSQVCTFLDVDYYISRESLKKLLLLIETKKIASNPNIFLILPCVFLSEEGTNFIKRQPNNKWDTLVQYDIVSGDNRLSRFLALSSSSIVINRHKFLELGGNDREYIGHGYEDFDLSMRLFKSCGSIESLPESINFDTRSWNFCNYKGFRSLLSVMGFEILFYGICMYHFFHIEPNNNGYNNNKEKNHQKFYSRLEKYKIMADGPDPLLSHEAMGKKCLIFAKENSSPYRSLRGIVPYIGELICKNESDFFENNIFDSCYFENYLRTNNISKVIFPNPYGNEKRLSIYEYTRCNNIKYLCYDRGALPDSWFLDSKGFNYDSISYSEEVWNIDLDNKQIEDTLLYIENIKNSDNFLEAQGGRVSTDDLRKKLGVRNKKVVFIPMQVEDDTVIKYFTKQPFDYYGFINIVDNVAAKLAKNDWVFIAKQHPLMKNFDKLKYNNIIFAPDNTNINSLVEMSNIVLTINSGVGVYAMLFEKPCLITGNAFYQFDGLNVSINSEEELFNYILKENFYFNKSKMIKFIHYLRNKFYSFGKSYYRTINEDNRIRRIVNYIDFYHIVIEDNMYLESSSVEKFKYTKSSLALRPYLFELNNNKNKLQANQKCNNKKCTRELQHYTITKKIKKLFNNPKLFFADMLKKHKSK